ncbi:MAG: NADPH:quinone oxidoreductase family protein [Xenococcaceae cyanobacterium MO_167.B27]|nr:NADPH:quinone oxidoreductase family protein [Xenococcaceae cyanobacterium MO_167.B27]
MKAARIHEYGNPTSVRVDNVEVPEPNPGEVRIRVRAAGMNNSDLQTTYGTYRGYGFRGLPHILGQEAAGEVDAVGSGVTEFVPGMRVVGHVSGAFAEYAIAPVDELLPICDRVSFEVAASLPIAYLTASMALIHKAKVKSGEWVLVHPGSGGVGTAAIQLTKLLGGRVIATAGNTAKVERLKELGAEHAFDYSKSDVVAEVRNIAGETGVQVALDGGGKVTLPHCLESIANNGRIVSYGYTTGIEATIPLVKLIGRNVKLYGIALWYNNEYRASLETLRKLVIPAVAEGKLQPAIDEVVSLEGVASALLRIEQRGVMGKIVVVPT